MWCKHLRETVPILIIPIRTDLYRFLANPHSSAAPAAIPATVSPVRFIDLWIAASWGPTQASSG